MAESQSGQPALWEPPLGLALTATIVGGLIAFAVFHWTTPVYEYQAMGELPIEPTPEQVAAYEKAHTDYYSYNFAYELAITGICLGLAVGAVTTKRRRIINAIAAGALGGIVGGLAGYLAGIPTGFAMAYTTDPDLVKSALYNVAIWGSIGAAIAGVVGANESGAAHAAKCSVVGLIGGCLAAVAVVLVFSLAFPNYDLMYFVPNLPTSATADSPFAKELVPQRIVWVLTCTAVYGLLLGVGLKPEKASVLEEAATSTES